jgi:hypothetical protein
MKELRSVPSTLHAFGGVKRQRREHEEEIRCRAALDNALQ